MYYEINVSKNGWLLFKTDKDGINNEHDVKAMCKLLKEKFPEEEGYEVYAKRIEIDTVPLNL